jgi:hypothetical protein
MSQQEFVPQSHEEQPQDKDELYPQQPYYWSTKPDGKAKPKEEPLSSYSEPMVQDDNGSDYQQGYMAQDHATYSDTRKQNPGLNQGQGQTAATRSQQSWSQSQQQQFAPGGNTPGQKYGATPGYEYQYNYQYPGWRVPPWARPQQQQQGKRSFGGFWLIILGLVLLGPLLRFLGVILAIGFSLALPFIVVGLFAIPFLLFRAITRRRRRRGPPLFWMDR